MIRSGIRTLTHGKCTDNYHISQKARINQTSKKKWHRERQCTWDELIKEIAKDQDRFEGFLDVPDTVSVSRNGPSNL